jgi:ribose transport system ATP-binding protein
MSTTSPGTTSDGSIASAIAVRELYKGYSGVPVLRGVTFDVPWGSVTALAGANGAGKSTLVRILTGDLTAESGEVTINGVVQRFGSPSEAHQAGLGVVRQELDLVPSLTVAENLFLAAERPFTRAGLLNRSQMGDRSMGLLERVGLRIDPRARVEELSIGDRQLVAVARALRESQVGLLLDEPTSSLSPWEVGRLHATIRQLAAERVAVIYVSHRLGEIASLCDRALVLRDGRIVEEFAEPAASVDAIARAMIPGLVDREPRPAKVTPDSTEVLRVSGLFAGHHGPADFRIHSGEIVGVFGLVGAGRSAISRAIAGIRPPSAGTLLLEGKPYAPRSPVEAFRRGVAYLSEDRKGESIIPGMSIRQNIGLRTPGAIAKYGWISSKAISALAKSFIEQLSIQPAVDTRPVDSLSGGNQQKVVLSRLLAEGVKLLILDEPTHGIDVAAKVDLLNVLREQADKGLAVVLVSSELEELISSVDRLIIMRRGRVEQIITDLQTVDQGQVVTVAAGGLANVD